MRLVFGQDVPVAAWVAHQFTLSTPHYFAPYVAIGIEEDNIIRGGVIYSNFRKDDCDRPLSIEISGASIDKRCASKYIIKSLLTYPFIQLRVKRVHMSIAKPNMVARLFAERLGFTLEGIARQAHFSGKDAAIYSLLYREWKDGPYGRRSTISTGSTRSQHGGSGTDSQQSADRTL